MTPFTASTVFALAAAIANILGGLIVTRHKWARSSLRYFIALGSGFMLATVFLEMVPESFHRSASAPALILAGYAIVHFFEHAFAPHLHFGEETHHDEMSRIVGLSAFVGMLVHTFFDGVAIGAGFLISDGAGFLIFLAVFLHKIPDGFTIASVAVSSGYTAAHAIGAAAMLGIATLIGVFAVHAAGDGAVYALPIAAGCTLYVAATDLMPEANRETGARMAFIVFAGMGLFLLVRMAAGI